MSMTERERKWWNLGQRIEFLLDLFIKLGILGIVFHVAQALAILAGFLKEVLR